MIPARSAQLSPRARMIRPMRTGRGGRAMYPAAGADDTVIDPITLLPMGAEVAWRLDVSGPADRSAGALVMSISSGAATTGTPLTISKGNPPSPIWVTSRGRGHGPARVGPGAG